MTIYEIDRSTRKLLSLGKLREAIDQLIAFLTGFSNDDLLNNTTLISAQLAFIDNNKIALPLESYMSQFNRLTNAVLEIILGELAKPTAAENSRLTSVLHPLPSQPHPLYTRGKLMHNIPSAMTIGVRHRCTIRIAPDEIKLLKDFEKTDDTHIQDIPMAEVMEVELRSDEDAAFDIEALNSRVQRIDFEGFTQWLFFVKPLKEGEHTLYLKVGVVEIIHGREVSREVVLEKRVHIVALEPQMSESAFHYQTAAWQPDGFTINYSYAPSYSAPQSSAAPAGKRRSMALLLLVLALGSAMALGYFIGFDTIKEWIFGKKIIPPPPVEIQAHPVVLIYTPIAGTETPPSVWYNDTLIDRDSVFQLSAGHLRIALPQLNRTYVFLVKTAKDSCRGSSFVTDDNAIIRLTCFGLDTVLSTSEKIPPIEETSINPQISPSTSESAPPEVSGFNPSVPSVSMVNLNHFSKDFDSEEVKVTVDGQATTIVSRQPGSIKIKVKNGSHRFVLDNGSYICETRHTVKTTENISFPTCSWTVKLNVNRQLQQPQVRVDGRIVNAVKERSNLPETYNLVIGVEPLRKRHTFSVESINQKLSCEMVESVGSNNQQILMPCRGIRHKVQIKLNSTAADMIGKMGVISIDDGQPFNVVPTNNTLTFEMEEIRSKMRKIQISSTQSNIRFKRVNVLKEFTVFVEKNTDLEFNYEPENDK